MSGGSPPESNQSPPGAVRQRRRRSAPPIAVRGAAEVDPAPGDGQAGYDVPSRVAVDSKPADQGGGREEHQYCEPRASFHYRRTRGGGATTSTEGLRPPVQPAYGGGAQHHCRARERREAGSGRELTGDVRDRGGRSRPARAQEEPLVGVAPREQQPAGVRRPGRRPEPAGPREEHALAEAVGRVDERELAASGRRVRADERYLAGVRRPSGVGRGEPSRDRARGQPPAGGVEQDEFTGPHHQQAVPGAATTPGPARRERAPTAEAAARVDRDDVDPRRGVEIGEDVRAAGTPAGATSGRVAA